jgi:hypothetical protein
LTAVGSLRLTVLYSNQKNILDHFGTVLEKKIGHKWGGLGDVAVFLAGVYRNEWGKIRTFTYVPF